MSKSGVQSQVEELLRSCRISKAPVPVQRVAKHLGIDLRFAPTKPDVSGALIVNGKDTFIAVNDSHHTNRQRFTIAHEIGHFMLHKNGDQIHFDEDFRVYSRNGRSALAVDPEEIEANQFAAELLMPRTMLWSDFPRAQGIEAGIVESLSKKYQVSRDAMRFRLQNLGLLLPGIDE